jgi:hypothetical protein
MSILDNGTGNIVPQATRVANQLVNMTVRTYQQMVESFNRGSGSAASGPTTRARDSRAARQPGDRCGSAIDRALFASRVHN